MVTWPVAFEPLVINQNRSQILSALAQMLSSSLSHTSNMYIYCPHHINGATQASYTETVPSSPSSQMSLKSLNRNNKKHTAQQWPSNLCHSGPSPAVFIVGKRYLIAFFFFLAELFLQLMDCSWCPIKWLFTAHFWICCFCVWSRDVRLECLSCILFQITTM